MSRYDYDRGFDETWAEMAWDDVSEELTSTLGRSPSDEEIEARISELWDEGERAVAEAEAEEIERAIAEDRLYI